MVLGVANFKLTAVSGDTVEYAAVTPGRPEKSIRRSWFWENGECKNIILFFFFFAFNFYVFVSERTEQMDLERSLDGVAGDDFRVRPVRELHEKLVHKLYI